MQNFKQNERFIYHNITHTEQRLYDVCLVWASPSPAVWRFQQLAAHRRQVPANRLGFSANGGPFNIVQLKVIQEGISIAVFCVITNILFQGTHLHWNHILAFLLIICAVYLVFMK